MRVERGIDCKEAWLNFWRCLLSWLFKNNIGGISLSCVPEHYLNLPFSIYFGMWDANNFYSLFRSSAAWGFGRRTKVMYSCILETLALWFLSELVDSTGSWVDVFSCSVHVGLPLDFGLLFCIGLSSWVGVMPCRLVCKIFLLSISTYFYPTVATCLQLPDLPSEERRASLGSWHLRRSMNEGKE